MAKIHCTIFPHAQAGHLQQLFTGFLLLHRRNRIELEQRIARPARADMARPQHLRHARNQCLRMVVNDEISVYYDTHDSHEIDEEALARSDSYFKRSFRPASYETLDEAQSRKIHPLGLNYSVRPAGFDGFNAERLLRFGTLVDGLGYSKHSVNPRDLLRFSPTVHDLEAAPDPEAEPRILFMARLWDPFDSPDRSPEKIAERREINETRANLVRALKTEFGDTFSGGIIRFGPLSESDKDLLIPDRKLQSKRTYIAMVKAHPICVATAGLHGSTGWKFAEYVALSRAILSERLNHEVPGDLAADENYLAFDTVDQGMESAHRLVTDRALRKRLMTNNARYYQNYLRPDVLVMNSIRLAMSMARPDPASTDRARDAAGRDRHPSTGESAAR